MKIVYFNYMWDLWGASIGSTVKALKLLEALRQAGGHEVKDFWLRDDLSKKRFWTEKKELTFRDHLKKHLGYYLHEPNQLWSNRGIHQECEIIEREKPDLVISRLDVYLTSPEKLSKKYNVPFLIEVDSPRSYEVMTFQKYYHTTKWLIQSMEMQFLRGGKAGFTVSNQMRDHFVKRGMPLEYFSVLPNAADTSRFNPQVSGKNVREQLKLNDSIIIGFVGSFIPWHGVENLMNVIEKVLPAHPEVKFLLVGKGGSMSNVINNFIRNNRLEDRVILPGHIPHEEIPQYIAAMDILLAPYPEIDFFYYSPVKIYEYMACGKPVISSRIGQIAELIEDQKTGFLTRPGDIPNICSIISDLIKQPALRTQVGMAAGAEIQQHHTWIKRGEALSALCQKVIS